MLINLGSRVPFTDSFPVCQATRKTVALHSTLLVLLGEKSGRWSSSPRHCASSNRSCAHHFAPKWSALTTPRERSQSVTRLPELHVHGLARSATIRFLKVEWMSHAHAMKHGRDRSRKRARTQWARERMQMILNMLKRNLKLLGGFISNGEPPPPPPPPVYAPEWCNI